MYFRWKFSNRLSDTVIIMLWAWVVAAASLMLSPAFGIHEVNPAIAMSEDWMKITMSILIVTGSLSILMSGRKWEKTTTSWKYELVGLPLVISGWLLYTVSVWIINQTSLFPLFIGLGSAFSAVARFRRLLYEKETARETVEMFKGGMPDALE